MFLKMGSFFLEPHQPSTIQLYNGTFEKSDNIITRDRMIDVSLTGNGNRIAINTSSWTDDGKTTVLNFDSGEEGTWVAGVSTKARNIELEAEAFNDYLVHDGVLDMLEYRKTNSIMDQDAVEKYSKHVKTVFQVGDKRTDDWSTILGYPIEFVPMSNPYTSKQGDELSFKLLWQGQPLANQLVYAGGAVPGHQHEEGSDHDHSHDEGDEGHHHDADQFRTNDEGIVSIPITESGHWYVRTIHMEEREEEGLPHESNWATITFQIGNDAVHEEGAHHHGDGIYHTHEDGTTHSHFNYAYLLGGVLLLGLLFWVLRRKK